MQGSFLEGKKNEEKEYAPAFMSTFKAAADMKFRSLVQDQAVWATEARGWESQLIAKAPTALVWGKFSPAGTEGGGYLEITRNQPLSRASVVSCG